MEMVLKTISNIVIFTLALIYHHNNIIMLVPKCQKYSNGMQQGTSEVGPLVVSYKKNLLNAKQVFLQIWLSHGFYCYFLSSTGVGSDAALHPGHLLISSLHEEPK